MIKILLIALSLTAAISQAQAHADTICETPALALQGASVEQDSTKMQKSDGDYWKKALRRYDFSIINDPEVRFPKFLQTCVNVYRWGDKTATTRPMWFRLAKTGNLWQTPTLGLQVMLVTLTSQCR